MRHLTAIDGLRAIAVLAVVAFHSRLWGWGYLGVDVFFVLSGFLITSILAQQDAAGGIRLGQFYLRRARRLYPALCVMVLLYLLAAPFFWPQEDALGDSAIALTYLSDYGRAWFERPGALAHTWSLSIEEHYYLLWPLLLPFLLKLERRKLAAYLLAGFAVATLWRMYAPVGGVFYRFDTRLSGLLLGSLLAVLPALRIRWWLVLVAGLAGCWWFRDGYWAGPLMTSAELASAGIIMLAASGRVSWLGIAPLAYLGRISYGVYLYHFPIATALKAYTTLDWSVLWLAVLGISVPLAALSYHTVEAWFRSAPRREAGRDGPGHLAGQQT